MRGWWRKQPEAYRAQVRLNLIALGVLAVIIALELTL